MQSLSEIDTTSKRASKAAGFSWGIAEEIGKAIRSLELFGLPGVINLNLYLKKIKKNHPEKLNKIDKENKPQNKPNFPTSSGQFSVSEKIEIRIYLYFSLSFISSSSASFSARITFPFSIFVHYEQWIYYDIYYLIKMVVLHLMYFFLL